MKVTITQACYVDGSPKKPGDVVDTSRWALLIGAGKAEQYVEKADPVKQASTKVPTDLQTRSGDGRRNSR